MLPLLIPTFAPSELLTDGGFEGPKSWAAFERGFEVDRQTPHGGKQSIVCRSSVASEQRGAQATLTLNQTTARPVVISGWSRAEKVDGAPGSDYAIYIDAVYTDGTPLWGVATPFSVGTHGWQKRKVLVQPTKPLRSLTVFALFRGHTGTAWFDDFSASELKGAGVFDGQSLTVVAPPLAAPKIRLRSGRGLHIGVTGAGVVTSEGRAGGFMLRDGETVSPMLGTATRLPSGAAIKGKAHDVAIDARIVKDRGGYRVEGDVRNLTGKERALTLYFAVPEASRWLSWGDDIRRERAVGPGEEYSNLTAVSVGAGAVSLYPFACLHTADRGLILGNQMEWPSVARLFYNGPRGLFVIAWDVALTGKIKSKQRARFRFQLDSLNADEAKWGFRAAARRFYDLNPEAFKRRAVAEGIWMPFTDPARIEKVQDFGIAYHEGDNSIASDNRLGILSFRYSEPMSYWMPMAPKEPRTYENAIRILHQYVEGKDPVQRWQARATLKCASFGPDGRYNMQFRKEPWCDGALFVLNPNPAIPSSAAWPSKAAINDSLAETAPKYRVGMDGEYLDSLEAWSGMVDYRPDHLALCPYPLTFDSDGKPALPQWFSTYGYAQGLSARLHKQNRLLMANSTPIQYAVFAGLLDVMGIETNWLWNDGTWHPDDDATFNLRRTLSFQRPYLLLQNTDYHRFTSDHVRRYFERSMFYGVYPSMFSADAATNPYWEDPTLYNRDRALFRTYIPLIRTLSKAGWQPITKAHTNDSKIYVERYGPRLFTVFNDSGEEKQDTVTFEIPRSVGGRQLYVNDVMTGARFKAYMKVGTCQLKVSIPPEKCLVLRLEL